MVFNDKVYQSFDLACRQAAKAWDHSIQVGRGFSPGIQRINLFLRSSGALCAPLDRKKEINLQLQCQG